jgi:hypothetical protein
LAELADRELEPGNGKGIGGLGDVGILFDRNSASDLAEWTDFQFTLCDLLRGKSSS